MKLEDVLDDLCARFIINLPEEERSSFERLGFQVEQAFWFYDDFYRPNHPHLPRLTLRSFGKILLQRYPPLIAPFGANFDKLYDEFVAYKHAIPVCGAIILNENLTKVSQICLLVKGWSSKSSWGFPKGKIGKDEDPADCAVREVFEETGFDISSRISSNNFIDAHNYAITNGNNDQKSTRLFIIPGVPESTTFLPQTRKEISKIQWHKIDSLPSKPGQDNSFYNVVIFVKKLRHWIKTHGKIRVQESPQKQSKSQKSPQKPQKQQKSNKNTFNNFNNNDIFDKLRMKNDNSPVNSIIMRDNPSPIHLFEAIPSDVPSGVTTGVSATISTNTTEPRIKLLNAIETFSNSLKFLKVNRSVIRESINKIL